MIIYKVYEDRADWYIARFEDGGGYRYHAFATTRREAFEACLAQIAARNGGKLI